MESTLIGLGVQTFKVVLSSALPMLLVDFIGIFQVTTQIFNMIPTFIF